VSYSARTHVKVCANQSLAIEYKGSDYTGSLQTRKPLRGSVRKEAWNITVVISGGNFNFVHINTLARPAYSIM